MARKHILAIAENWMDLAGRDYRIGTMENDKMFDDRTLKMESSVQKDTGFMVCLADRLTW